MHLVVHLNHAIMHSLSMPQAPSNAPSCAPRSDYVQSNNALCISVHLAVHLNSNEQNLPIEQTLLSMTDALGTSVHLVVHINPSSSQSMILVSK